MPTDEIASIQISHPAWTDSKMIGKRLCNGNLKEIDGFRYEIDLNKIGASCALIEYMVSPVIIEFNNFPMYAVYNLEKNGSEYIVQLKYQVSSAWKSTLDEVVFNVFLNSPDMKLLQTNSRGEIIGNSLEWKANKLIAGQKGVLEASLKASDCRIDHAKIQFKSNHTNLSQLSASFSSATQHFFTSSRFMAEIVISNT